MSSRTRQRVTKTRLHRILGLAALSIAVPRAPTAAQEEVTAPVVLSLPASTRALGLGNTFLPFGGDPDAVFYQPAALSGLGGASAALQVYGASSVLGTVSSGGSIVGGTAAIGFQYLVFSASPGGGNGRMGDLLTDGTTGGGELVGSLGWSREVLGVRAGIVGKLIEHRNGAARDATGALDVGVTADAGPVTLSASAQNLGPALNAGFEETVLPRRFALGVAMPTKVVGPLDMTGGAQVSIRRDKRVIPSGGVEIRWWPIQGRTLVGRVGVRRTPEVGAQPVTVGAAFIADGLTLEYAFESFDGDGSAHRFGLRWR